MFAAVPNNDNANSNNFFFNYQRQESLKLLRKGFERSVSWNEYKKQDQKQDKWIYFFGVNRLFVLFYSNQDGNAKRFKIKRYYLKKGIIKDYYVWWQ